MTKTKKQVVSGYHRPVCVKCRCEMWPETNGVGLLDLNDNGRPYELWDADLWQCPSCKFQVVGGFAYNPISVHYQPDFAKMREHYKERGILIENKG